MANFFRLKAKEVAERCCNVLSDGASLSFWKTCLSSAIERVRGVAFMADAE
jgi:hypothetical protein